MNDATDYVQMGHKKIQNACKAGHSKYKYCCYNNRVVL